MLDIAINDLVLEVEQLNGAKPGTEEWVRQQALSFGLSFLRLAKSRDVKDAEGLDKLRKRLREQLNLIDA